MKTPILNLKGNDRCTLLSGNDLINGTVSHERLKMTVIPLRGERSLWKEIFLLE